MVIYAIFGAGFITFAFWTIASMVALDRLVNVARSKGYRSRALELFLTMLPLIAWTIVTYSMRDFYDLIRNLFLIAYSTAPLLGLLIAAIIVALLPRRKSLNRRSPFFFIASQSAASVILIVAPLSLALLSLKPTLFPLNLYLRSAITFFLIFYLEYARRVASSHAGRYSSSDKRAYFLYLRTFESEVIPISDIVRVIKKYSSIENWFKTSRSFEEQLTGSLEANAGPVIALGNPLDISPSGGAERVYIPDSNWQDLFDKFTLESKAVLMIPGHTTHLAWELKRIRQLGATQKFIVILPHLFEDYRDTQLQLENEYGVFKTLALSLSDSQLVENSGSSITSAKDGLQLLFRQSSPIWPLFYQLITEAGYECPPDTGPGSILAFSRTGTYEILATGLYKMQEYAPVVSAYLARSSESEDRPLIARFTSWCKKYCPGTLALTAALFIVGCYRVPIFGASIHIHPWWELVKTSITFARPTDICLVTIFLFIVARTLEQRVGITVLISSFVSLCLISGLFSFFLFPNESGSGTIGGLFAIFGMCGGLRLGGRDSPSSREICRCGISVALFSVFVFGSNQIMPAFTCLTGFVAGLALGLGFSLVRDSVYRTTLAVAIAVAGVFTMTPRLPAYRDESPKIRVLLASDQKSLLAVDSLLRESGGKEGQLSQALGQINKEIVPVIQSNRDQLRLLRNLSPNQQRCVNAILERNESKGDLLKSIDVAHKVRTRQAINQIKVRSDNARLGEKKLKDALEGLCY